MNQQTCLKRNWSLYNLAQTSEKLLALKLLNDSVNALEIPYKYTGRGRPSLSLDDAIKAMIIKVFNNFSSRRCMADIQLAKGMNYIEQTPHFNILCKYMRSPEVTYYLHKLYLLLALPLVNVEEIFCCDATGFSVGKKHWVDYRLDHRKFKYWKKLHVISGVKSNVIVRAEVSDGKSHDSPFFKGMVRNIAKYFNVREVSADAAYLSKENCDVVKSVGAVPYIRPKSNSRRRARGSWAWKQMIDLWQQNRELFLEHYHQRSNVESVFSAIKRKYLPYLRSKSEQGQFNEMLCKVVCNNLSVLVDSIFSLDIAPNFKKID